MKSIVLYYLIAWICSKCPFTLENGEETAISSYIKKNEYRMEMLRNWDIYYETERDYWSCKHWYDKDSLLSFMFIYMDGDNHVQSYDIAILHGNDSINATQNINTLYELQQICKFEGIGAHEAFSASYFDFIIHLRKRETEYQILHVTCDTVIGIPLYGKWIIRNKTTP